MTTNPPPGDEERKGSWLQTFSGLQFYPLDPRAAEVNIGDIAHALSLLCRYNGHCEFLYSVAQHSVYVSYQVRETLALIGLLHDAAEAYCADVPRPIKRHLHDYMLIEERIQRAIGQHFGVDHTFFECEEVKRADNAVMLAEKRDIMLHSTGDWEAVDAEPSKIKIHFWNSSQAETAFLRRFYELTRTVGTDRHGG